MYPYVTIFGEQFPSYGILMLTGGFLAILFACIDAKRKGIDRLDALLTAVFGFLGGILGAKLLFIIGEIPDYISYFQNNGFSWAYLWQEIMNSGLVFYGGLIGGVLGGLLYTKMFRLDFFKMADALLPFLPLAHGFGRLGCTCAGCCYGIEMEPPFGIHFPHSLAGANPNLTYAPTQLWEALFCLLILFPILMIYIRKPRGAGRPLGLYALLYGIFRFAEEIFRGEQTVGGHDGLLTISQIISLILIPIGAALLLGVLDFRKPKTQVFEAFEIVEDE